MRKARICALMMSLVLLTACAAGGTGKTEKKDSIDLLQEEYRNLSACDMVAQVSSIGRETAEHYTLHCSWSGEGTSRVEVLEPEEIAGISAVFDQNSMELSYEGVSLAAGFRGEAELSPAELLPRMLRAVQEGYVLEKNVESMKGQDCARLLFTVSETGEHPVEYTVWFKSDHTPVRAEAAEDGRTLFVIDFSEFTMTPAENTSNKTLPHS